MYLEIITPESKVFSGSIESVSLPGINGSFQLLKGHAPIISALQKGKVKVDLAQAYEKEEKQNSAIELDNNPKVIYVNIVGGVVEMQNEKVIVLAE